MKVVGVSRDPMKKHDKFIGKYGLAVPLVSDEDGRISDAFGTWVEKSMYGRKYMGMERATYLIGADGRVLKAWRKVKVPEPRGGSAEGGAGARGRLAPQPASALNIISQWRRRRTSRARACARPDRGRARRSGEMPQLPSTS